MNSIQNRPTEFIVTLYYSNTLFLFLLIYITVVGGTCGYLSNSLHRSNIFLADAVLYAGILVSIILPIILFKWLRKQFMRTCEFIIYNNYLNVKIFNLGKGKLLTEKKIRLNDISACSISFQSEVSTITMYLTARKRYFYCFNNEAKTEMDSKIPDNNFALHLFKNIYLRNGNIDLLPSFYAAKRGKIAFLIVTSLLILLIFFGYLYNPKAFFLSIFPVLILYLYVFFKRKTEIKEYQKYKKSMMD